MGSSLLAWQHSWLKTLVVNFHSKTTLSLQDLPFGHESATARNSCVLGRDGCCVAFCCFCASRCGLSRYKPRLASLRLPYFPHTVCILRPHSSLVDDPSLDTSSQPPARVAPAYLGVAAAISCASSEYPPVWEQLPSTRHVPPLLPPSFDGLGF